VIGELMSLLAALKTGASKLDNGFSVKGGLLVTPSPWQSSFQNDDERFIVAKRWGPQSLKKSKRYL